MKQLSEKQCQTGEGPNIYIRFPDDTPTTDVHTFDIREVVCEEKLCEAIVVRQKQSCEVVPQKQSVFSSSTNQRNRSINQRKDTSLSENTHLKVHPTMSTSWEHKISVRSTPSVLNTLAPDATTSLNSCQLNAALNQATTPTQKRLQQLLKGLVTLLHKPLTSSDIKSLAVQINTCGNSAILKKKQDTKLKVVHQQMTSNSVVIPMNEQSILLVEDEPSILKFTARMLEKYGFVVTKRTNGYVGLNALKENIFNVAIIDLNMPVMDGLECVRRFRGWEEEKRRNGKRDAIQYIIVLSGDASRKEEVLDAGANVFLLKPIKISELVAIIQSLKN